MLWEFIKKRWFSVALVLLVLIAIARKNIRLDIGNHGGAAKKEKYTETAAGGRSSSMLALTPEGAAGPVRLPEIEAATAMAFFKRFGQVAVDEQAKFGIPAPVLLAAAYVNSFAGQRDCATQANNYLAVRCTAGWSGPVETLSGTCFRKYNTAWESFRDFNVYLSKRDWFKALKASARDDWKAWVEGLDAHGVSDVAAFGDEMAKVIREYSLEDLE